MMHLLQIHQHHGLTLLKGESVNTAIPIWVENETFQAIFMSFSQFGAQHLILHHTGHADLSLLHSANVAASCNIPGKLRNNKQPVPILCFLITSSIAQPFFWSYKTLTIQGCPHIQESKVEKEVGEGSANCFKLPAPLWLLMCAICYPWNTRVLWPPLLHFWDLIMQVVKDYSYFKRTASTCTVWCSGYVLRTKCNGHAHTHTQRTFIFKNKLFGFLLQ